MALADIIGLGSNSTPFAHLGKLDAQLFCAQARRRPMRKALISAFMLVSTAVSLYAQTSSPNDLNRRIVERRAFEAVVWGMPVVNYDLMVQEMLSKTSGKVNQVIYWGRPLDSKNQTLTPNPDALYFIAFYNTKDGPMVLDLPPADDSGSFNANIVTVWQMPLEDAGRLGVDKGQGVKLLILPPDYTGTPPEGYATRQSDTFGGYMLFRANLKSHSAADVDASIAYGKKMKIYPLTQAANSPATVSPTSRISISIPPFGTTRASMSAGWFTVMLSSDSNGLGPDSFI